MRIGLKDKIKVAQMEAPDSDFDSGSLAFTGGLVQSEGMTDDGREIYCRHRYGLFTVEVARLRGLSACTAHGEHIVYQRDIGNTPMNATTWGSLLEEALELPLDTGVEDGS